MGETRQLGLVVGAGLAIGLIALVLIPVIAPLFAGSLTVSSYEAVLYENGTLSEQYTYNVGSSWEYSMLYRYWEAPLTLNDSTQPYIRLVSMTPAPGTIGYIKDNSGNVTIYGPSTAGIYRNWIKDNALYNEVGIFNPSSYNAGTYTAQYTYVIHPPLEQDATTTHLNLKLAGETHIPYRSVKITIPAMGIDKVYAYPPSLHTEKVGDGYVITGSLAANEILAVEMLGTSEGFSSFPGFRTPVDDISGKTAAAGFSNTLPYYAANLVEILGTIAIILVPLSFIVIYSRYGREKVFTVPAYLSTMPSTTLKPWQVNLLFKADALSFDKEGYYATLLDLHRRKVITIKEKGEGKGIEIRVLSEQVSDPYEQRVLAFIAEVSENGVLDTDRIEALAKKAKHSRRAEETTLAYQRSLANVTKQVDPALGNQYVVNGRHRLIPPLTVGIALLGIAIITFLVAPTVRHIAGPALVIWVVVCVQVAIAFAAPSTLFGRWKDDRYKEKLEWDAFAHFLSDMAMIQKYTPADLSMWGDWLIYGTALGVGEKVEKAMQSLNVRVADVGVPVGAAGMNHAFIPLIAFTSPSHGGGFGGGGGGGFGGGGAGGR